MQVINASVDAAKKSNVDVTPVIDNANSFVSSNSNSLLDYLFQVYEKLFRVVMQLLNHEVVEGHLDDLIGQRMFIQFILFSSCICVVILFILFIFNLIFVFNKDKVLSLVNNKLLIWFIRYELFVSRITLIVFPVLILLGLYTIGSGLA